MNTKTVAEIMASFIRGGERVEKMPKGDPMRIKGERLGERFTEGVAMLKLWPSPDVRTLMSFVWDIVGNRVVPTALGPEVPTLTFAAMGNPAMPDGILFVPHNWEGMIQEDPVCQLGALVFVGSQVVDYYNKRVGFEVEAVKKRARANEAEFLLTIKEAQPDHKFNDWQRSVLDEFPQGLRSERIQKHLYTFKPFVRPA